MARKWLATPGEPLNEVYQPLAGDARHKMERPRVRELSGVENVKRSGATTTLAVFGDDNQRCKTLDIFYIG
jgi:hypothetical protein